VLMHPRDRRIDRDHPIQSSSRDGLPLHLGQQSLQVPSAAHRTNRL
jgi:hypothetical protein